MGEPPYSNLDDVTVPGPSKVFKWAVVDKLTGQRRSAPSKAEVERVTPDLKLIERDDGVPRMLWVGHSSAIISIGGRRFLTDPVVGHLGPIRRNVAPALDYDGFPHIDALLISHNHRDHLDSPTIKRLDDYERVIAPEGLGTWLTEHGCKAEDLPWWESTEVKGVKITAVPAQHWSRRGLLDTNQSHWCGFVLEADGRRVYYAGDTGYFRGYQQIADRFPQGFDLSLSPIGAYDPQWFMSSQHQNPEEAGKAAIDIGARKTVGVHWGTFKLTDEPLDEPPMRARQFWGDHPEAGELDILPIGGISEGILKSP